MSQNLLMLVIGTATIVSTVRLMHRIPNKKITLIVLASVVYAYFSHWVLDYSQELVISSQKEKLLGYAPSYAITLEQHKHHEINEQTSVNQANYLRLIKYQMDWLKVNPFVSDIFTLKKAADGTIRLIVDSETDYNRDGLFDDDREKRTSIGEIYSKQLPEIDLAFRGEKTFTEQPYQDKWGYWVSAFVPMYGPNREVDGVLGVDFDAQIYMGEISKIRSLVALSLGLTYLIILSMLIFYYEVKQSHNKLARALNESKEATKIKAQFLANMSHEIRTPMNGILGMANLLADECISPQAKRYVRIIKDSGESLLVLINDILDFSKIESGKMLLENQAFNIKQALNDVLDLLSVRALDKGLIMRCRYDDYVPDFIFSDITRLRQILTNLISNAIKFTQNGGVYINISATELSDNNWELHFKIRDTGIGIPQEVQNKLFQSFSQVDASTTKKFGGTGLGLAICKGLCESMGGKIWVESCANQGSTFHFTIQAKAAEATDIQVDDSPAEYCDWSANTLHVLLVEDNTVNQLLALKFLEKIGLRADVAANGVEALDAVGMKKYDLVLMDCHMPEMDGFEATRRIHQRFDPTRRPKIVALTASVLEEDRQRCKSAGMDDILHKPLTLTALRKAVSLVGPKASAPIKDTLFDKSRLLNNFQGMEDVLSLTIDAFVNDAPVRLSSLKQALENKDAAQIRLEAHTLKGAIGNFQAEQLMKSCFEIEQLAAKGQNSQFEMQTEFIEQNFPKLLVALKELQKGLQKAA